MSAALVPVLALLAGAAGSAWGQAGIYTCVDAHGKRITSDRPILECLDREQKELNPTGTVRRIVPPSLTASERAVQEERDRKMADERLRAANPAGSGGRTGGRNDQWSRGSGSGRSSAGTFAPCSIQARILATCSGLSGCPSGGMR